MALFSLGRRRESGERIHIAALARETLRLGDEDGVTVSQIDCGDPACEGGAETFILILRKGERTRAAKVSKAMALVRDEDVLSALQNLR